MMRQELSLAAIAAAVWLMSCEEQIPGGEPRGVPALPAPTGPGERPVQPGAVSQEPGAAQDPPPPMRVPRTLAKYRGEQRIVIDGVLQDWPEAPPLLLIDRRQLSGTAVGAWRGAEDLAAQVFLLWDENALFVAAVVRDDWHRPLAENSPLVSEIPPADNLVLTIDPRRDTRSLGADQGRSEDAEFWLADVAGQDKKVVLWDRLRGTARFVDGGAAVVVHDLKAGLTTYEARIPWSEILPSDLTVEPGFVFDLQVVVNDYDEITDLIPQTRIGWTFGTGPRIDPGLLGSVMLMESLDKPRSQLPQFPDPPEGEGDPVPDRAYWIELQKRLRATRPVAVGPTSAAPDIELGTARLEALTELEGHLAAFPRIDHLEYHYRVHRRMRRESEGMADMGLPFYWQDVLDAVGKEASEPPPKHGFRIFRLPAGGWLVRSSAANFGIDPAGYNLERHIWGALDFVLLTSPLDVTKRNDQTLLRMAVAERSFYTHVALHLPGIEMQAIPLVTVGQTYAAHGVSIRVLGLTERERVSPTAGYVVTWPDGTSLVHSGASATAPQIASALPKGAQADLLLVSADHPGRVELARQVGAKLTVLDDVLRGDTRPGSGGRLSLEQAFALQTELRPLPTMIVAPGESVDIGQKK